ncbi:MAG: protein kinase [Phycisphaerae bacterium]
MPPNPHGPPSDMKSSRSSQSAAESASQVQIVCPACSAHYYVPAALAGRRFQCRKCAHVWRWGERDGDGSASSQSAVAIPGSDSNLGASSDAGGLPVAGNQSSSVIDMSWAGRRLGRYQLKRLLGRGGMGTVWEGFDATLNRATAIKILNPPSGRSSDGSLTQALFLQEARAAAKLNHPGAITVFEIAQDQAVRFIAMEMMHRGTLKDQIDRSGPIEPRELFRLMIAPAGALALAHARGIIHRDIKPGNLMFDDLGRLKLGDFGLSDVAGEQASASMRGRAVGSLGWVAPETARGEPTTAASDIYAFGLVLFFALTGQQWLNAPSRSRLLELHQNPPEPNLDNIAGLSQDGRALLLRCLAKDPDDRFHSADELATFLEHCGNEPDEPVVPVREVTRSRNKVVIGAAVATLLVITLTVLFVFGYLDRIGRQSARPLPRPAPGAARPTSPSDRPDGAHVEVVPVQDAPVVSPGGAARDVQPNAWPGHIDESRLHFVSSKVGRVYHRPGCEGGRKIFLQNLQTFDTPAAAEAAGKTPCPHCKPNQPN